MSLIIAPYEAGPVNPTGGNFPNNLASMVGAGYGLFSGNPNLKTSEELYSPASTSTPVAVQPVSMAPIPAPSNFGSTSFPIAYYDPNANYGDPMQVVQGGVRG